MQTAAKVVGVLLMLIGVVWILQGINVLPGSFMTGQMKWAYYGAVAFVLGIGLFVVATRTGRLP